LIAVDGGGALMNAIGLGLVEPGLQRLVSDILQVPKTVVKAEIAQQGGHGIEG
jgi:hypothetical protein